MCSSESVFSMQKITIASRLHAMKQKILLAYMQSLFIERKPFRLPTHRPDAHKIFFYYLLINQNLNFG